MTHQDIGGNVIVLYYCVDHDKASKSKPCCKNAVETGWLEEAETAVEKAVEKVS